MKRCGEVHTIYNNRRALLGEIEACRFLLNFYSGAIIEVRKIDLAFDTKRYIIKYIEDDIEDKKEEINNKKRRLSSCIL